MYGLTKKQLKIFTDIIFKYKEKILQVKLFGSRARGNYRKNSDIDIAVTFSQPIQSLLATDFEKSKLPYNVDIVNFQNAGKVLLENIERDGKLLFQFDRGGEIMTVEQVKLKYADFERALKKLQIALEKDITADELYLDGLIQRFEFCFELSWKLMQAFLSYEGFEVNSPRSAIRKSFETEIISNAEDWLDMLEKKNLSTHTYDEDTAKEIYRNVKEKYIFLFTNFNEIMKEKF